MRLAYSILVAMLLGCHSETERVAPAEKTVWMSIRYRTCVEAGREEIMGTITERAFTDIISGRTTEGWLCITNCLWQNGGDPDVVARLGEKWWYDNTYFIRIEEIARFIPLPADKVSAAEKLIKKYKEESKKSADKEEEKANQEAAGPPTSET